MSQNVSISDFKTENGGRMLRCQSQAGFEMTQDCGKQGIETGDMLFRQRVCFVKEVEDANMMTCLTSS
jgi:hypothetical protein